MIYLSWFFLSCGVPSFKGCLNFWQSKSNTPWLVQIFEAMLDLYFSCRSGSDRSWLPVRGEERNQTWCWEMTDLQEEMIMSGAYLKWEFAFLSRLIQCSFPVLFLLIPIFLSSLFSFSSFSFIPLSFPLLPHFLHSLLSISCLHFLPPSQPFLLMTFMLQRSWDTLRQRWERISVEFNLELCFTPRQWNSSPIDQWNIALSLEAIGGELWHGVLSVCQSGFTNTCLPLSILFCCQWCWD